MRTVLVLAAIVIIAMMFSAASPAVVVTVGICAGLIGSQLPHLKKKLRNWWYDTGTLIDLG